MCMSLIIMSFCGVGVDSGFESGGSSSGLGYE